MKDDRNINNSDDEETFDITKQPYMLYDKVGYKGELIVIVGRPKDGKTFSAINIAESDISGKVLYLLLDDLTRNQLIRFKNEFRNKITVITAEAFEKDKEKLEREIRAEASQKAFGNYFTPNIARLIRDRDKLIREFRIKDTVKFDNLLVFELLMENPDIQKFDTIIVDSLNQLIESPNRIILQYLKRLIKSSNNKGKSVVFLHHINKFDKITGGSAFFGSYGYYNRNTYD